jgi:sirohydrochlorin ferrochelatase
MVAAPSFADPAPGKVGVLVLAHGGRPEWNEQVKKAVKEAKLDQPVEIAFGMGMMPAEVEGVQAALNRLEKRKVNSIVVLPLLVSSDSSVYRQFEYLFGFRDEPSWPEHGHEILPLSIPRGVQIRFGHALDRSGYVSEILLARAEKLSKDPAKEAIVIVAHGPETAEENAKWLASMENLSEKIQDQGGFSALALATLQDDAPPEVRDEATRNLREKVQTLSGGLRVIVVPLLLSRGGIEKKIPERLKGLEFVYSGETLLPDPKISLWIKHQVDSQTR